MPDPLRDSLDALTRYFVGDTTMGETLDRVCRAAVAAVEPAAFAGVSMTVDARVGTYVFTHPDVEEIDRKQYDTGDGPCLDAFRTGQVVRIRSTLAPGPYPDFRAAAANHGMRSVISVPMDTHGERVGALNLYSEALDAFEDEHIAIVQRFAEHGAFVLANTKAYWDARLLSENLEAAMRSRAEIEQAKGIIMGSMGCTADEAFEELRRQSQHENVKLREIAAEIVNRAQRR